MEQHLPIIVAKKFWNLIRVALFMLKKGISKSKLLADLNMMLKRGKLAGKAIQNLMFHHTHHWSAAAASSSSTNAAIQRSPERHLPLSPNSYEDLLTSDPQPLLNECALGRTRTNSDEDEFISCGPSPDHHHGVKLHQPFHLGKRKNARSYAPPPEEGQIEAVVVVMRAVEMLKSETMSPEKGFGKNPVVRQLRVTDSPFPINYIGDENDKHVDEAADQFIQKFYKKLRSQNKIAWGTPGR